MSAEPVAWQGGTILRALRLGSGLTQQNVAHTIGIHHSYVAQVEMSSRRPSLTVLKRWVLAIGCPKISPEVHLQALWHLDTDPWLHAWEWAVSQRFSYGEVVSQDPVLSTAATGLALKVPENLEATDDQQTRQAVWHALIWLGTVALTDQHTTRPWTPPDNLEGFWMDISAASILTEYGVSSESGQEALGAMTRLWPYLRAEDQTTLLTLARRLTNTSG